MKAIDEALAKFGYEARLYYNSFEPKVRSGYCSYVCNHKIHNVKATLLTPREWDTLRLEKEELPTFEEISQALKLGTTQCAYSAYKRGLRQILKIIRRNPHKYPAIIEAGGLVV